MLEFSTASSCGALGTYLILVFTSPLGTRLCFHKGSNKEWQDVEDFARTEGCDNEEDLQMGTHKVDLKFLKLFEIFQKVS